MLANASFNPNYAVVPGHVLEEYRQAQLLTQRDLANRMGMVVKTINQIENGKEPISPTTALKLESVLGLPAHVWMGLESRYREFSEREKSTQAMANELAWLVKIPYNALCKLGWVIAHKNKLERVRILRAFFRVASLNELDNVWKDTQVAYRKSTKYVSKEWAILAWLTQACREAEKLACLPFNESKLRQSLASLSALSCQPFSQITATLTQLCADCGVALVFLPAPKGTSVSGATSWLSKDCALIQLSPRFKSDDQFWFSFFHEIGHVLLHSKKARFIDFCGNEGNRGIEEQEADLFAASHLISEKRFRQFIAAEAFSAEAIIAFAKAQNIAAGIVVGRMQFEKILPFKTALNSLKQRIDF